MTEDAAIKEDINWKSFFRKHWTAASIFGVTAFLALAAAVYVFVWFVGNAQSTGLVPATLDMWTMNNMLLFALHAVFWELVLIGIPVAIGAVIGWQWWKRLPEEEKSQYHLSGKRSQSRTAEGAISPLLFIAFAIKVYLDGNWNVAISTWTVDYVVGSMITILIWIVAIFAIPAVIGIVWWIRHETNKKP